MCLSVVGDSLLEGLMYLSDLGEEVSRLDAGKPLLYIEHLGVAPANQRPPVGTNLHQGIGSTLLKVAAAHLDCARIHASRPSFKAG